MARNAAVVLGNTGARRHLPVLRAHLAGASAASADEARWAIDAIVAREGEE
jgi:hypothetical protein